MARPRKKKRQACSVEVTASGLLRFRFRARMPSGAERKFAEATALRDTPQNRDRVQRQAQLIGAEIRAGAFDYLKWFPNGNRASEFLIAAGRKPIANGARSDWTIRRYYADWIDRKTVPNVRASAARDYRGHFNGYILDVLGDTPLDELSLAHIEDLRTAMRKRKGDDGKPLQPLSDKTIRNVIDGSLRAMVRDAIEDDIPAAFPFPKVRWPEKIVPGPSPFTAEERDKLLDYFAKKKWKAGGFNDTKAHYPYFALLYTLFFTGMRPSEAVALRIRSLNLKARTLQVDRSRHLGEEAPPKTARARRAVRLTPKNAEVLSRLIGLKAKPDGYLFLNIRGEPIIAANFYDLFRDAQTALEITPLRDLYSAKDSYISLALTNGVSLTWLSEQTGVAVATLLKHYGRFIHSTAADDLELSKIDGSAVRVGHRFGHRNDAHP
jgi:integrase